MLFIITRHWHQNNTQAQFPTLNIIPTLYNITSQYNIPLLIPIVILVYHNTTVLFVSSHSCCMNVSAGRPAFDWPYAGVHRSTSLTISSLLLQQCPACLVRLACIVFVIGGRWPYSWCRVGCCCQDLFNIARNILVYARTCSILLAKKKKIFLNYNLGKSMLFCKDGFGIK